jgi:cell division protein FtsB
MATPNPRRIARENRNEIAEPLELDRLHLQLVRPDGRRRPQIRLTPRAGVSVVVLLFVALFLVAASHALLIQNQVKLDDLDKKVATEQARYEDLRQDVAEAESPEHIQEQAAAMGMVPGGETVWITPDQQAAGTDSKAEDSADDDEESPDTSYSDVKPYLGSTP